MILWPIFEQTSSEREAEMKVGEEIATFISTMKVNSGRLNFISS